MDEFTHGGTPPTLWPKARPLGSVEPQNTISYREFGCMEWRIAALAEQVERLSWMVEFMGFYSGTDGQTLEDAEAAWLHEHANLS